MSNNQYTSDPYKFFDAMKSYINPEAFTAMTKTMPVVDFASFEAAVRKNTELFTEANKLLAEGAQSILKRNSEILQSNATGFYNTTKDMLTTTNAEQAANYSKEHIKSSITNSINGTKELADMMFKSSMAVFQLVGDNITNRVDSFFTKSSK